MRVCRLWLLILFCLPLLARAGLFEPFDPTVPPTPLQYGIAVETGDVSKVGQWLEAGLSPDFMADRIGSGLMIAAWYGNLDMMRVLLDHGTNVNLGNGYREQALQFAAWRGHLDAVKLLVERGAQVNRDGDEWGALHYATFAGHEEVARFLIGKGANVNARTPNQSTPLMLAAREGKAGLAEQLLAAGADATAVNEFGDNALAFAMRNKNFGIAKMVAPPQEFATAVAHPEVFGEARKSILVTDEMHDLINLMNEALAAGRPVDAIRQQLYTVLARYREEEVERMAERQKLEARRPQALVITADRNKKGAEKAELRYAKGKPTGKDSKKPDARTTPAAKQAPKKTPAKKPAAKY